ncbi:MAG: hypothetical protein M1814_002416 [Vezdaea aestivalis]|nr:MAG: hypothetical protein M1814_002416 [Vezdaea aestivalis]
MSESSHSVTETEAHCEPLIKPGYLVYQQDDTKLILASDERQFWPDLEDGAFQGFGFNARWISPLYWSSTLQSMVRHAEVQYFPGCRSQYLVKSTDFTDEYSKCQDEHDCQGCDGCPTCDGCKKDHFRLQDIPDYKFKKRIIDRVVQPFAKVSDFVAAGAYAQVREIHSSDLIHHNWSYRKETYPLLKIAHQDPEGLSAKHINNEFWLLSRMQGLELPIVAIDVENPVINHNDPSTIVAFQMEKLHPIHDTEIPGIMAELWEAVDQLNDAGYVHGSISRHNVMKDDMGQVKLIDFGLAGPLGQAIPLHNNLRICRERSGIPGRLNFAQDIDRQAMKRLEVWVSRMQSRWAAESKGQYADRGSDDYSEASSEKRPGYFEERRVLNALLDLSLEEIEHNKSCGEDGWLCRPCWAMKVQADNERSALYAQELCKKCEEESKAEWGGNVEAAPLQGASVADQIYYSWTGRSTK